MEQNLNSDGIASDSTSSQDQLNVESKTDTVAYDSYQKLLKQKKSRDAEVESMRAQLEQLKEGQMLNEGKKDEVIASQREKIHKLESENKKMEGSYAWNIVGNQIKQEMAARGVRNPEKAFEYARAVHASDLKLIDIDSEYNVNTDDKKRFVDEFLKANSDMGFVGDISISDQVPSNEIKPKDEKPSIEKMSDDELMSAWAKNS